MTPGRFWSGFAAVGLAVEAYGLSHKNRAPWALSPNARRALRCDTRAGQAITIGLVGAGSSWLAHHLLTIPPNPEEKS